MKSSAFRSLIHYPVPWLGVGGAESVVGAAAAVLERFGPVDVLSGKPDLSREAIDSHFDIRLERTEFKLLNGSSRPKRLSSVPPLRLRQVRQHEHPVSSDYSVLFSVGHTFPVHNFAGVGMAYCLYPLDSPSYYVPAAAPGDPLKRRVSSHIRRFYYKSEIASRLRSYDLLLADSKFTAHWCEKRWGGKEWQVWYPPVDSIEPTESNAAKSSQIIAVGRFVGAGYKKQREMVHWLRALLSDGAEARLVLAGSCSSDPADLGYRRLVEQEASELPCCLEVNCSVPRLHHLYRTSRVYWHAMGYGASADRPEECEHFGITTVEAMSAGCVPVVIDAGGQADIVEHGVSGFRWSTPEQLQSYTRLLLGDATLWGRMSRAAIERARAFSRQSFEANLSSAVSPLLQ